MAVHILGRTGVTNYKYLKIWADRGLVHIEDTLQNSYEVVFWKTALLRIKAINEMRPGLDGTESPAERAAVYETRNEIQNFVDAVLDVIRKAKEQGSPDDPSAAHAVRAKLPKQILVPKIVFAGDNFKQPVRKSSTKIRNPLRDWR